MADAISNLALFIPLGAALIRCGVGQRRVLLLAALLSLGIEMLQGAGWPAGRTAASADWIANIAGAATGVMLVRWHALWLRPTRRASRVLVAGWSVALLANVLLTQWAITPARAAVRRARVATSPLPFTPGYGWFAARADSVRVNDIPVQHVGSGPVIVAMPRTDTVRAAVIVRGRDRRDNLVPIVFVHAPQDTTAHFLLGQRGNRATLRTALNAARVGLVSPDLSLGDVFVPASGDSLAPVRLNAIVSVPRLGLTAGLPDGTVRSARLALSPLMGWALIQTVVTADSDWGATLTSLWMLAWLVPWAYWLSRAVRTDRAS
jgi:hypothetical protein